MQCNYLPPHTKDNMMDPRETEIWNEPGISQEAKLLWVCFMANGDIKGGNYATKVFDLIVDFRNNSQSQWIKELVTAGWLVRGKPKKGKLRGPLIAVLGRPGGLGRANV